MVEPNGGNIRAVAWSEVFPWLSIFRTFRLAIGFRALTMAALAILLTVIGWGILGYLFSVGSPKSDELGILPSAEKQPASTAWLGVYVGKPWEAITALVPERPPLLTPTTVRESALSGNKLQLGEPAIYPAQDPVFYPFRLLNQPLREGLVLDVHLTDVICLILCGLWSLAIWAFFGAAICRIAAVQLASGERIGWGSVLRHSCTKYLSYLSAPLIPLVGVALAIVPIFVMGLIMSLGGPGVLLAAIVWPLLLVGGLVMTLLLLGLFFGWPLMWGTISTEGTDSFDALSRSYAYVFQRPVHYLFYAIVAAIFGWLGWILVQNFAAGIIWFTYWAASWGATNPKIQPVMQSDLNLAGLSYAGTRLIHFWTFFVKLLAVGYLFSFFWTAAAAIYLLLRRAVDATEMDEVFLDADESEKAFCLPKIATDEKGAPVAAEGSPPAAPDMST
jgi:hypothetical protein